MPAILRATRPGTDPAARSGMVFEEAVRVIRSHVESKFPKRCTLCGQVFETLFDYVQGTRPVGQPVSYDAAFDDWTPVEPIGTYTIVVCSCGTSLAIDSSGMNVLMLWRLMKFARNETRRTGETVSALLERIRVEVHRQVRAAGRRSVLGRQPESPVGDPDHSNR